MRVVTWNIRGGLGMDGVRSTRRIADGLLSVSPDIVCLQEVHRYLPGGSPTNQPKDIAALLGFDVIFDSAMRFGAGFGNATLSRWPLTRKEPLDLQNREERRRIGLVLERRILQRAIVKCPDADVALLNTHWSLNSADRLVAASLILRAFAEFPGPAILCGDLNAGPDAEEVRKLFEGGIADAGSKADLPTYPSNAPGRRIDYIWVRELELVATEVAAVAGSDHLPVVADVRFETTQPAPPSGPSET